MEDPITPRELMLLDERVNHISERLDNHISACVTRFLVLLAAISVASGGIAFLIEHHG